MCNTGVGVRGGVLKTPGLVLCNTGVGVCSGSERGRLGASGAAWALSFSVVVSWGHWGKWRHERLVGRGLLAGGLGGQGRAVGW